MMLTVPYPNLNLRPTCGDIDATVIDPGARWAELLRSTSPQVVVLQPGRYSGGVMRGGHSVYAAQPGTVLIDGALELGPVCSGACLAGLDFQPHDKQTKPGMITLWSCSYVTVRGCRIRNERKCAHGVHALETPGLRILSTNSLDASERGFLVDQYQGTGLRPEWRPPELRELVAKRSGAVFSNGTSGAGFWLGVPCTVDTILSEASEWTELWTGHLFADGASTIRNARLTGQRCHYAEHFSAGLLARFRMNCVNPANAAVTAEWADPSWGGRPAVERMFVWEDGIISGGRVGMFWDHGTRGAISRRVVYRGQTHAGIVDDERNGQQNRHEYSSFVLASGAVGYTRKRM